MTEGPERKSLKELLARTATLEELTKELEPSIRVFNVFGQAITIVTWVSFCVVSIFVLFNMLGQIDTIDGTSRAEGRGALLVLFSIVGAVTSILLLAFHFLRSLLLISEFTFSWVDRIESKIFGWIARGFRNYCVYGTLLLVVVICYSLSVQAIVALGLY